MCLLKCTKSTNSGSSRACIKSHLGICSPLIDSVVLYDFVSGQRRLRLDCLDVQADLGLHCPHMPEDTFLHG